MRWCLLGSCNHWPVPCHQPGCHHGLGQAFPSRRSWWEHWRTGRSFVPRRGASRCCSPVWSSSGEPVSDGEAVESGLPRKAQHRSVIPLGHPSTWVQCQSDHRSFKIKSCSPLLAPSLESCPPLGHQTVCQRHSSARERNQNRGQVQFGLQNSPEQKTHLTN